MAAPQADHATDLHVYQFGDQTRTRDAPPWAKQCPMETTMREDQDVIELGAASEVTLGIPKQDEVEDLTERNFKD